MLTELGCRARRSMSLRAKSKLVVLSKPRTLKNGVSF